MTNQHTTADTVCDQTFILENYDRPYIIGKLGPKEFIPKRNENISETLEQRGKQYGNFKTHAEITQGLKAIMRKTKNWELLGEDKREALEMIAHKIGRILNGNPEFKDSWHDILGYTKLIDDTLTD